MRLYQTDLLDCQAQESSLAMQHSIGTPQGGVVSPVLANLFLHYAFDVWVRREMPRVGFCRYADDGLLHCRSRRQAEYVMKQITDRFRECGLEIHPDKSSIVYCQDRNRTQQHPRIIGVCIVNKHLFEYFSPFSGLPMVGLGLLAMQSPIALIFWATRFARVDALIVVATCIRTFFLRSADLPRRKSIGRFAAGIFN
jgi:Reverse transcriptase (RNA-dependent DNA polymerase)